MIITNDRAMKLEQKAILKKKYADYNPKRHDVFVYRHNKEKEESAMAAYIKARKIENHE